MKYENLDGVNTLKTVKDMLRWSQERRSKQKDLSVQLQQCESKQISELHRNDKKLSITWIGHSTFLIQINGVNILTDPVWSPSMATQKRLTEPGLATTELPTIDVVLISHGHYDHLDFSSIRRLPGNPLFLVPSGLKKAFLLRGYKNVIEANWYEGFVDSGLKLTFVPAQHWTRRTISDTNTSHWGGWMIKDLQTKKTIYFVGDTGYFSGFKEIAKRFSIDYVLMPIGAFEPEWFMKDSHINPEDSIKAFLELNGTYFIPMHYGAYRLADDTGPEALNRLVNEWNRLGLADNLLKVLRIGETLWEDEA